MAKKLKITLVIITTLALVSSFTAARFSSAESGSGSSGGEVKIEKELRLNTRDAEVVKLQQKLKAEGLFKVAATGFFGNLTEKALKEFQKNHDLPATGMVDEATKAELNGQADDNQAASVSPAPSDNQGPSANSGSGNAQSAAMSTANQVQALVNIVKQLLDKVQKLQAEVSKLQNATTAMPETTPVKEEKVDPAAQTAAGVIITGGVSGPGYPTGPLNITLPATQLLLDRVGTTGQNQVKDRQYEAPMETIPPTMGAFPVTINGVANTATELKVISNLKTKNGVGQHQGTIDVDIDTVPTGHVTLQYNGTATVVGSTITSKGTFKTSKVTGMFAGLVAEGTYDMTITESGTTFGSPVTVSITTVSP